VTPQKTTTKEVQLDVNNIGGIDETNIAFNPGVTILTGRNATNRSSFLQAIMAALGSSRVSLKGDADEGSVNLQIGDKKYNRTLERQNGTIQFSGNPYLSDPELGDLFAFLLKSNEARRAVELGEDLRDIIMRPVDSDAIQTEINQLKAERDDIDDRIEEFEQLQQQLPKLEEKRTSLSKDIREQEAELEEKREELDELSTNAAEARADQSELEEKIQTLQQKRSELDTVEFRLESEHESLDSLQSEKQDLESEYEGLNEHNTEDIDHIESEISQLRERKQQLESDLSKLQNIIQFNEEMLDGTSTDIAAALRGDETNESVTNQLLDESNEVVCWTCGTEVKEEKIEETLDRLRDLHQSKYNTQNEIEEDLSELKEQKRDIESTKRNREKTKQQIANIRSEIDQRKTRIEELKTKREDLTSDIDRIQEEIENLEEQDRSEVLEVHRGVNELEIELERLQDERERIEEEIDKIQSREEEIEALRTRREQINDQLEELRTRIDRIEEDAVEEFNDHMDTVLDLLAYDTLDRIWIERVERETRQGRRKVETTEFRLHIVRSTEDGISYEDEFEHLSESEQEVTGLVFALAGYLAHKVYEKVPFMLLDSLEAIDSERIAKLVDYIQEYADYLVIALLTEDAAALDENYRRIENI
jgi:chromosome segregation ATPase